MTDFTEGAVCGVDGCNSMAEVEAPQRPTAGPAPVLDLTIVSDAICPWCYVAKRRLEKALAIIGPALTVRTTWKPFELNPHMPTEGMDRHAYRSRKFGSWERSQRLDAEVAAVGAQEGLAFHHERMARTPNTFDAHRLIWLAGQEGVQDAVVEGLFRAYFTDGRDVSDHDVLADIAAGAGIPAERARAFLAGKDGTAEVSREEIAAAGLGVAGVPAFVANGRQLFSGAQRVELMAALLRQAAGLHAA